MKTDIYYGRNREKTLEYRYYGNYLESCAQSLKKTVQNGQSKFSLTKSAFVYIMQMLEEISANMRKFTEKSFGFFRDFLFQRLRISG